MHFFKAYLEYAHSIALQLIFLVSGGQWIPWIPGIHPECGAYPRGEGLVIHKVAIVASHPIFSIQFPKIFQWMKMRLFFFRKLTPPLTANLLKSVPKFLV